MPRLGLRLALGQLLDLLSQRLDLLGQQLNLLRLGLRLPRALTVIPLLS